VGEGADDLEPLGLGQDGVKWGQASRINICLACEHPFLQAAVWLDRFVFSIPGRLTTMACGDGGKAVFEIDDDRKSFVFRLRQVFTSHGCWVHAWVLMRNHFHLLLETPQANLVTGMQWLLSTFSQGWNRARLGRGQVFQGRYKSVPVTGTDADAYCFRIVADYIHHNPARAGLAGGHRGPLTSYKWSSLPSYIKGSGPDWLVMERVLCSFGLKWGQASRINICLACEHTFLQAAVWLDRFVFSIPGRLTTMACGDGGKAVLRLMTTASHSCFACVRCSRATAVGFLHGCLCETISTCCSKRRKPIWLPACSGCSAPSARVGTAPA
jgi:REP element-mobilizing transposase RayT